MDSYKPSIEELLEQLEDAREAGHHIEPESLCARWPDLLQPLKERWERLLRFERRFSPDPATDASDATRRESTAEVEGKIADMADELDGTRVIMQTEIHLERFHDRGGLGEVYRAQDCDLSREVAVKLLRVDRQGESNREDFFRESRIIGGMNHPGIVAIHGTGETIDGRPFYTMPFLDGGTLRQKVTQFHRQNPGPLVDDHKEFRDLLYRMVAVCKTIAYAHSRGIVHRDLKAENVLLGKYGETLVIDWGCASKVNRDERFKVYGERTLQLKGVDGVNSSGGLTLRYASPEQLHGGKVVGPESDIYSLGAMLYLLITGKSPLEHEPDEKVRSLVMKGQVPAPESIKGKMSRTLSAICRKAMSLESHDRYENALQMAEDLERFMADAPTSVCKQSWGLRLARLIRRNRKASLMLLSTMLIASTLLAFALAGQSVLAHRAEASAEHRLRMAAALVSNVGGFEIGRRISLLELEATKIDLIEAMTQIQLEPQNQVLWKEPQALLHDFRDELLASGIKLDSLFINDATGIQIARVPKEDSIGNDFAYRQYFHGGDSDLDPKSPEYQSNRPKPSDKSIVSNVYISTSKTEDGQAVIKTALSVPIVAKANGQSVVVGRLNMSLLVQELAIFDSLRDLPLRAVLFETRNYAWGNGNAQGVILDRFNGLQPLPAAGSTSNLSPSELTAPETSKLELGGGTIGQYTTDRLLPATLQQVETVVGNKVQLIEDMVDPAIGAAKSATACAALRIPYRPQITTGWKVIFIEAD